MRIDIHFHSNDEAQQTAKALRVIEGQLRLVLGKLGTITENQETIMANIDDLEAAVAADATVDGSAIVLLTNLTQMIADLKTNQTDPATGARIDAAVAQLQANKTRLAEAVSANTPAETP